MKANTGCACLWDKDGKWVARCGFHAMQDKVLRNALKYVPEEGRPVIMKRVAEDLLRTAA